MAETSTDKDLAADVLLAATRLNSAIGRAADAGLQVTLNTVEEWQAARAVPTPHVELLIARPL